MQNICRSCGFQAHKPEDLIDGQCPRWAPESPAVAAIDEAFAKLEKLEAEYRQRFGPIPSPAERLAAHTAAACGTITKAATA